MNTGTSKLICYRLDQKSDFLTYLQSIMSVKRAGTPSGYCSAAHLAMSSGRARRYRLSYAINLTSLEPYMMARGTVIWKSHIRVMQLSGEGTILTGVNL